MASIFQRYKLRSPVSTDAFSLTEVSIRRPVPADIPKVNAAIRAEEKKLGRRPSAGRVGLIVVSTLADLPLDQARRIGGNDMAILAKIASRAFDRGAAR